MDIDLKSEVNIEDLQKTTTRILGVKVRRRPFAYLSKQAPQFEEARIPIAYSSVHQEGHDHLHQLNDPIIQLAEFRGSYAKPVRRFRHKRTGRT